MKKIDKIRYILNIAFLIGAAVTVILYFSTDGGKPYYYSGIITISTKVFEYILRFVY